MAKQICAPPSSTCPGARSNNSQPRRVGGGSKGGPRLSFIVQELLSSRIALTMLAKELYKYDGQLAEPMDSCKLCSMPQSKANARFLSIKTDLLLYLYRCRLEQRHREPHQLFSVRKSNAKIVVVSGRKVGPISDPTFPVNF